MALVPMKRGDIPLSAIDFHISSIIEELMQKPTVSAAAQAVAAQCAGIDPHDALKRAMWLFRSSSNTKRELGSESGNQNDGEKQSLHSLWQAAQAAADAWSVDYICRRFA